MTCKTSPTYNGCEALQCTKIKLEITATFAGTWIELQQPIICSLAEYMVGCAWSRLARLSPSALESLTFNSGYTVTSTEVDMRRYFVELCPSIVQGVSEQQCLVPGHVAMMQLGSVSMIMWMLTMHVVILTVSCTEQIV